MTRTVLSYEPLPTRERADPKRFALLALLCAAASIAYAQRSAIAVPANVMQSDLKMDKVEFGAVMSTWLLGYAVAQIPSGWLGDQWGSRASLAFFALLWSAATALVGLARGYHSLLLIWLLMGVAQAGIFPCSARAIRGAFPDSQRASATGLLGAFMGIGAAMAPVLVGLLLVFVNWRCVFALLALPGIAWALAFYHWRRPERIIRQAISMPAAQGIDTAASAVLIQPTSDRLAIWSTLVTSGSMWLLCAQQFLRAAAMIFFLTWFPTFLHESRGVTILRSGFLTALAGVGAVAGSFLGGFSSDLMLSLTGSKRLSRQGIAVAGMTTCAALIVAAYFIANTTLAVGVISLGAFCGTFGGVSGYTVTMDFGGKRVSTVFSIMNMCGNIGAAAFPLAIGWLVKRTGNWDLVLFIFAGIFATDAICWAVLNPKRPLFEEE